MCLDQARSHPGLNPPMLLTYETTGTMTFVHSKVWHMHI